MSIPLAQPEQPPELSITEHSSMGLSAKASAVSYRQRKAPNTVMQKIVRENLLTFLAEGIENSTSGEGYPNYVEREYRKLLECGDPIRGFARCRCTACGHEFIVPFSCKIRGLCPLCCVVS